MPIVKPMEINKILGRRMAKRKRNKEYFKYLVKRKGNTVEDSTWMTKQELQLQGFDLIDIKDNSFVPKQSDVGASYCDQELTNLWSKCGFIEKNESKVVSSKTMDLLGGFVKIGRGIKQLVVSKQIYYVF